MQCRSHVVQLGRQYDQLKAKNVEVLLILGADVEKAKRYAESQHLPFPVLSDPERSIYHLYGLDKILLIQRTASVIVDCNGVIRYMKTAMNPFTWLQESQEVLDFIKSMPVTC